MKVFKNRVAVVTGAASGIGTAMAEIFIEAGMKVVLADVDEAKLQNTFNTFHRARIQPGPAYPSDKPLMLLFGRFIAFLSQEFILSIKLFSKN